MTQPASVTMHVVYLIGIGKAIGSKLSQNYVIVKDVKSFYQPSKEVSLLYNAMTQDFIFNI